MCAESSISQDAHLETILLSAQKIMSYLEGITFEKFWDDDRTRDAVAMRLAVIGESARHINDVTERRLPEIPFSQIAGMRHRIAHDYQR